MSSFLSYAFKTVHPTKPTTNADMSANTEFYLAVFDGVSGVASVNLKPEDLSWDMREQCKQLLDRRTDKNTDRNLFNKEIAQSIGMPLSSKQKPGEWLRDLAVCAALRTSLLGATTMAMVSLMRGKMAYFYLGDVFIRVYRPLAHIRGLETVFESRELATTIRTHDGQEVRLPKQFGVLSDDDRAYSAHKHLADGEYGVVKVHTGDIVLVGSDGVSDNLSCLTIKATLSTLYFQGNGPKDIATKLVGDALRATRKPDDTTLVVAFVE
jgi:serine/threonine protein phosphatase PrpC